MKSVVALGVALALLAGCVEKGKESPVEAINASIYPHTGQPKLTVFTMVNNRNGAGAHTALLVQNSQSALFDPAGSFQHERLPERGDVIYGMSPGWIERYKSAHAREAFHVVIQEIPVTAEQASVAMNLIQSNGPVPSAMCASATSGILRQIPGFSDIRRGFYPLKLMEQVEQLPNVTTTRFYENDDGNVLDGVRDLAE